MLVRLRVGVRLIRIPSSHFPRLLSHPKHHIPSSQSRTYIHRSFSTHINGNSKQPLITFKNMTEKGLLRNDPRQLAAITKLNDLYLQLQHAQSQATSTSSTSSSSTTTSTSTSSTSSSSTTTSTSTSTSTPATSSSLSSLWSFASKWLPSSTSSISTSTSIDTAITPFRDIKGLYMYGGVGSGKTMLMDLFYQHLHGIKRVRKHFHPFMLDIHARLHKLKQDPRYKHMQDPLTHVAREFVSREAHVLCLDEFQVVDVADAMILQTLFTALWNAGCVVVATSNRAPTELYINGINRDVFLPFIDTLQEKCVIYPISQGQDHRLLGTISQGLYHYPLNDTTKQAMNNIFQTLSEDVGDEIGREHPIGPRTIPVMMGRTLHIPMASHQVARFTFQQLCETALGAADYIALSNAFKYVMIDDVPIMRFDQREKIRRFITLLDVLYENNVCLIISAEAPLNQLFQAAKRDTYTTSASSNATSGEIKDETFASARALSRLTEMQSTQYLNRGKLMDA